MAEEELIFLKDQVQRLNAVISQYQEKYFPINEAQQAGLYKPDDPRAPWLTERSLLSPLIAEYDNQIMTLKKQTDIYQRDQRDSRSKADALIIENKRLQQQLQETVRRQIEELDELPDDIINPPHDEAVINNLMQQIELLKQEKDGVMEMCTLSNQELDRVQFEQKQQMSEMQVKMMEMQTKFEQSLVMASHYHHLKSKTGQLTRENQQISDNNSQLQQELDTTSESLRKYKAELRASNIQLDNMRKSLEEMRYHLHKKEDERNKAVGQERSAGLRISELQTNSSDLETKYQGVTKQVTELSSENKQIKEQISNLQRKSGEHERREFEAINRVRDSIQLVENAVLEKDQALVREQQKVQEVDRLQEMLNKVYDEAGIRTKQEVDEVRELCNKNISKLMDEITTLENDIAEKQAQTERAVREKRAVESELEKVYKEGVTGDEGKLNEAMYDRALKAEQTAEQSIMKLQTLQNTLKNNSINIEQEKTQYLSVIDDLKKRNMKLYQQCQDSSEAQVQLQSELGILQRDMDAMSQNKSTLQRKCTKEIASSQQEAKLKENELESRLESMEDLHQHTVRELRQMLNQQHNLSAKWREESKSLSRKLETKVNELRDELTEQKKRHTEMTELLQESRSKNLEGERVISDGIETNRKLHKQLVEVEKRAALLQEQLSKRTAKEKMVLQDNNRLQVEIDNLKIDSLRSGRLPGPSSAGGVDIGYTRPSPPS